jgi:hypothetical protein
MPTRTAAALLNLPALFCTACPAVLQLAAVHKADARVITASDYTAVIRGVPRGVSDAELRDWCSHYGSGAPASRVSRWRASLGGMVHLCAVYLCNLLASQQPILLVHQNSNSNMPFTFPPAVVAAYAIPDVGDAVRVAQRLHMLQVRCGGAGLGCGGRGALEGAGPPLYCTLSRGLHPRYC